MGENENIWKAYFLKLPISYHYTKRRTFTYF